eukprot:Rhum_TRINITY_DN20899_c0_g1::Rhum_TRINITY_DN20899_c0_g1_i1::g.172515::m.172515
MTQWAKCVVALLAVSMLHVCSAEVVARPTPSTNWRPEKTEGLDSKVYDSLQLLNEMQSVYIGRSEVQGVGLFSSRTFEKGETVMRFTYGPNPSDVMHWVPFEVVEAHLSKEQAAKVRIFWAHNETHTFVPFAPMLPDALQNTFFVHYLNHAHDANIAYEMPDGSYRALRRVLAGEELLIDYRHYCPECYKLDIEKKTAKKKKKKKQEEEEEEDL